MASQVPSVAIGTLIQPSTSGEHHRSPWGPHLGRVICAVEGCEEHVVAQAQEREIVDL